MFLFSFKSQNYFYCVSVFFTECLMKKNSNSKLQQKYNYFSYKRLYWILQIKIVIIIHINFKYGIWSIEKKNMNKCWLYILICLNSISYILFLSQETVLKFHAQAKRWIAYTVISGSLAVVAVTGILVGMYLTGNLSRTQEENNQIAVSNEGLK